VVNLLGDPSKAKRELGWNPQSTSFEQLVELMVAHDMKKVRSQHFNLAEYLEKGIVK
jgi:GDPmannose 4,6-dehydratase